MSSDREVPAASGPGGAASGPGGAARAVSGPAATAGGATAGSAGVIYDIQGFSVQDGPGIRTTVFLKGCPLRCPWCHSPESQRFDIQLSWQWRKCIGLEECGLCLGVCPRGAIGVAEPDGSGEQSSDDLAAPGAVPTAPSGASAHGSEVLEVSPDQVRLIEVDWARCDDCGACAERCPAGALSMWGKPYTVAEVVERVLRDRPFFERSGGGVTVSGGEPLSQATFTLALLEALKERGLHTALDTTGFAPWTVVEKTLPYVDLYLLDLKGMNPDTHRAVVGVPNDADPHKRLQARCRRRQATDTSAGDPPLQRLPGGPPGDR